nr:hypothetical protein GCM10020092_002120 [Actinoplanes digitatis]
MTKVRLTWDDVSSRRLARHHLTDGDRAGDPAAAAAGALGIHAQVMSAAEVSIGIRTGGVTRAGVRDALWAAASEPPAAECSLIKSRGPRGTVHLLAAADLPMWTGALQAVPCGASPFAPGVRMTGTQTDQVVAAISDAVAVADAPLTVDELTAAIVVRAGPWAGERVMPAFQDLWPRWRQAEAAAMNRGAMCFGPDRARRATYMSPARRIAGFRLGARRRGARDAGHPVSTDIRAGDPGTFRALAGRLARLGGGALHPLRGSHRAGRLRRRRGLGRPGRHHVRGPTVRRAAAVAVLRRVPDRVFSAGDPVSRAGG